MHRVARFGTLWATLAGLAGTLAAPPVWSQPPLPRQAEGANRGLPQPPPSLPLPSNLPTDWEVDGAVWADVTGDGRGEWVLTVWRPWRDVHMAPYTSLPTLVQGLHDASGRSCHIILIEPLGADGGPAWSPYEIERGWREVWAGSALSYPVRGVLAMDVDRDGVVELTALEGEYTRERNALASYVTTWQWNGFGFSLEWRSLRGAYHDFMLINDPSLPVMAVVARRQAGVKPEVVILRPAIDLILPGYDDGCSVSESGCTSRRRSDGCEGDADCGGRSDADGAGESTPGGGGGA